MKYELIKSVEELRNIYDTPSTLALKKQLSELDKYSIEFLQLSPFAIISTANEVGLLDCSPRGDYPGFIKCLDNKTIAIPDRPGNNRLDNLANLVVNPNIGILVLIPGFKDCLRINGEAGITTDAQLLATFEYNAKLPKSVILVSIKEIYFHCTKAITRSKLWEESARIDRSIMPSLGRILMGQLDQNKTEAEISEIEKIIEDRVKTTLY